MTVDRQMRCYNVPRVAFINKSDRQGANPYRVAEQLRDKLKHNAVLMQIPIGLEGEFEGVVDLVEMKAYYFDGNNGEIRRTEEIPAHLLAEATTHRAEMLDAVSMFSDELMEAVLEDRPTPAMIREAVRRGTLTLQLTPVFIGSAYKNKGVQPLLDAVTHYLPDPTEVENVALDLDKDEAKIVLAPDPELPLVSVVDLGLIGRVSVSTERIEVELLPTFVGCHALEVMQAAIVERLAQLAAVVEVEPVFDPPWTSDRITAEGRRRLTTMGVAPPGPGGADAARPYLPERRGLAAARGAPTVPPKEGPP
jgi:elongation factor G